MAAFFVAASLLLAIPVQAPALPRAVGPRCAAIRDTRRLALTSYDAVMSLWQPILNVAFPLWLVTHTDAPVSLVGVLYAVASLSAILLQYPLGILATHDRGPLLMTGVVLTLGAAGWIALAVLFVGASAAPLVASRYASKPAVRQRVNSTDREASGRHAGMSGHSAAGRRCAPGARWNSRDGSPDDGESVQHGDLGPWNPLWGPAAGVIDWDLVEPGDPCYDTGFLAWFTVPFMDDSRACARGFPSPPERWARLSAFASGAGLDPSRVLGLGFAAQREFAARVVTRGLEPWPTLLSMGTREPARSELEWTRANLSSDRR